MHTPLKPNTKRRHSSSLTFLLTGQLAEGGKPNLLIHRRLLRYMDIVRIVLSDDYDGNGSMIMMVSMAMILILIVIAMRRLMMLLTVVMVVAMMMAMMMNNYGSEEDRGCWC